MVLLFTGGAVAIPAQAGDFTIDVGGRIQLDFADAEGDISELDISEAELRRLRLFVAGNLTKNVKYKIEINTNSSEKINFEDAYLQWTPTGSKWNIKAGQFKTPNSLDEQTSSRFISTLERAGFTDAFEFNRRLGAAVNTSGDNYTFSAGVFGDNLLNLDDQQSWAAAARGTYNPIKTEETLVHVGASVRYRDQKDSADNIRYRQRPFVHIPGRIFSTGRLAQSDKFYGAEAAVIHNRLWASGEYGITDANCATCLSDPSIKGGYVEAGAFINGKKTYKGGKFNRPQVDKPLGEGGFGAVSFVVRYDKLYVTNTVVNSAGLDNFIVGADWWPKKNFRFSVNYFKSDAELGSSTSGLDPSFADLVTNGAVQETIDGFVFRGQFDF
jgi:phosphate-selective porin OprO/OprP